MITLSTLGKKVPRNSRFRCVRAEDSSLTINTEYPYLEDKCQACLWGDGAFIQGRMMGNGSKLVAGADYYGGA